MLFAGGHTVGAMSDDAARLRRAGRPELPRWVLSALGAGEDLIYLGVALVLIGVAVALLFRTVSDVVTSPHDFVTAVTTAVNGVLFVVIVLEIFRTVLAHLQGGGFQLQPFLVIGIISSVRHILLIGAQTLAGSGSAFDHSQIELAVNAGVALVLVIALVLIRRSPGSDDDL
jgi:uncharacterized membrane protein (DUF373 family)